MFNFKKLKLVQAGTAGSTSSFVGIRRGISGDLEFSLPKGFDKFPESNFEETKKLFFRMYKTFKYFENDMQNKELDKKKSGKDNIEINGRAYLFKDSEENDVIIYSKISLIENMLEAYKDLSMDFIEKSIGKSDQIDYKKLDQYLDKAIYLDNDIIFIDEMDADRYIVHYQPNSLINLFCFIIRELNRELDNFIDSRVNDLANLFVDYNLSPDQSLFDETTFDSTIVTLKDILHEIDKLTAYKDERYWLLFEAVESFLYGELNMENIYDDGIFWGINNFFQVWEDMCNTYAFENFSILFADTNITYMGSRVGNYSLDSHHRVYKQVDLDYPFYINFRKSKRWMRPDLVHIIHSGFENIFTNAIQIEVRKNFSNRTINFDVRLIDKTKEKLYKDFCSTLDRTKNRGARKKNGKLGTVSFLNFFPKKLEMQKNRLLTKHQLSSTSTPTKARVIDWKYMEISDFYGENSKVRSDVMKQLCYEFCLSKLKIGRSETPPIQEIESIFVIPCYANDSKSDITEILDYSPINPLIKLNKIGLYYIDFSAVQEAYLKND